MINDKKIISEKEIYSEEELEFFNEIENNNFISLKKTDLKKFEEEKEIAKKTAKNTIKKITKKKSLNLRIFENDIPSIKAIALEKGLPYQTFLSSIIHQVATKQIKI
jgi:predicted DNA binding CopG/RHH family protein